MENKILEGHFQKCVYDVYMQFSAEKMCICSFVYMQFEKVDIYTASIEMQCFRKFIISRALL